METSERRPKQIWRISMTRRSSLIFACWMMAISLAAMPAAHAAAKVGRFAVTIENGRIATYAFDPATGQLRVIQSLAASTDSLVTIHPNNKFVYVPTGSNSIAGFAIGTTGLLTALSGSPFPTSFPAQGIYFTPSGKFGYTQGYPSGNGDIFSVNTTTGALTSIGSVVWGSETPDLAITAKGNFIYAANNGNSTISGFAINPTTGALTPVPGSPFPAGPGCSSDWIHPSGKFVYCQNFGNPGSISAYSIGTNGALTQIAGSPFPSPPYGGNSSLRGTPNGHFLYMGSLTGGVGAFSVNQSTGALTTVSESPFPAGSGTFAALADPSGSFLYAENVSAGEVPIFVFAIDPTTGALAQIGAQGLVGAEALWLSFTTGTAAVKYTPTFAYASDSGVKSISELSIASGGLTVSGTLADTNGPQSSVATANGEFVYTGNGNGSISEYKVGKTGGLTKVKGSPIKGLTNPMGMAISSFYNILYAEDPTADATFDYTINTKTGVLTASFSGGTDGTGPQAIAVDPFGQFTLVVNTASDEVAIGIPGSGFVNTVATGLNPAAITIDPSSQFVYVANSGDGTVSAYNLSLVSPYMTQIGSAVAAGTTPSAVVAEPYGRYLYVANSGDNTISAYGIDPFAGTLTPLGPFSTVIGPSALATSNDGKYLYVTGPSAGELQQFSINSDGTLTNAGGTGLGTATGATSITTIGTYK
jgi:6-phosphogluconolactonase (cycloisomerase 2 family)